MQKNEIHAGNIISFMHFTTILSAHFTARGEGISEMSLVEVRDMPEVATVRANEYTLITR